MTKPRHVLLTSVKDEGPYLLEFIAHHRVLGFDRHHFASNDCSDGTDLLLDALSEQGIITHTPNPLEPGDEPQATAYRRIRAAQGIDQADWIMVLDVDEFLQVGIGQGRVEDLTALAGPEVDIISLNALSFGTTNDIHWRPGLVTEQFTRRLPSSHRRNGPIKSLSRGGRFRNLHNHNPVDFTGKGPLRVLFGSGETLQLPETTRLVRQLRNILPTEASHRIAYYNHYPIKSLEAYCLRQKRGRGAVPAGQGEPRYDLKYWEIFAGADHEDHGISMRYGAALRAEIDRLMALPGIAAAQTEAEQRHRRMIGDLML